MARAGHTRGVGKRRYTENALGGKLHRWSLLRRSRHRLEDNIGI
jgi:hypothetical protein